MCAATRRTSDTQHAKKRHTATRSGTLLACVPTCGLFMMLTRRRPAEILFQTTRNTRLNVLPRADESVSARCPRVTRTPVMELCAFCPCVPDLGTQPLPPPWRPWCSWSRGGGSHIRKTRAAVPPPACAERERLVGCTQLSQNIAAHTLMLRAAADWVTVARRVICDLERIIFGGTAKY